MRCIVCGDHMSKHDIDAGTTICEICVPHDHSQQAMERIWGPKCPESDSDCLLCRAWKFFESKGKVPATEDCL
jgi:hypothetical protein